MKPTRPDSKVRRNLSKRWYNMMSRCHDESHPRFDDYGGNGVTVDERWKDKEQFLDDARRLPGFDEGLLLDGKLHLDKDTLDPNNKVYSPDTCVFVSLEKNNSVKPKQMTPFIATAPDGRIFDVLNQSSFAKEHGLTQGTISACLKGKIVKHRGWTFSPKE
jgi:hypothetical protein